MNKRRRQAAVDAVLTGWTEGAHDPAPGPDKLPAGALAGYCVQCGERHCFCATTRQKRRVSRPVVDNTPATAHCGKVCPAGNTWVKRQLGAAYDPDRTCPYTGRSLWPFAAVDTVPWRIEYWREDGYLFRVRLMTEAEGRYTLANLATIQAKRAQLRQWLETVRK